MALRDKEEYQRKKRHFNEYTLSEIRYSIPRFVWIYTKNRHHWYEGIHLEELRQKIFMVFKKMYKKGDNPGRVIKKILKRGTIPKASIYNAIRDLRLYLDEFYLVSEVGWDKESAKKEFRYFCPLEDPDINHHKEILIRQQFNSALKNECLDVYESHIDKRRKVVSLKKLSEVITE